jgi:hypothetical protein
MLSNGSWTDSVDKAAAAFLYFGCRGGHSRPSAAKSDRAVRDGTACRGAAACAMSGCFAPRPARTDSAVRIRGPPTKAKHGNRPLLGRLERGATADLPVSAETLSRCVSYSEPAASGDECVTIQIELEATCGNRGRVLHKSPRTSRETSPRTGDALTTRCPVNDDAGAGPRDSTPPRHQVHRLHNRNGTAVLKRFVRKSRCQYRRPRTVLTVTPGSGATLDRRAHESCPVKAPAQPVPSLTIGSSQVSEGLGETRLGNRRRSRILANVPGDLDGPRTDIWSRVLCDYTPGGGRNRTAHDCHTEQRFHHR